MSAAVYDLASRKPVDALPMRYAVVSERRARLLDDVVATTPPASGIHRRAKLLAEWRRLRAAAWRAVAHGDAAEARLCRTHARAVAVLADAIRGL
jgi:hypothetical protein